MQDSHSECTLLWFRHGLRIHDQPLFQALNGPALGVWVLDQREWDTMDSLGFVRGGNRRLKFWLEAVSDLRERLQTLGGDLIVRLGEPEAVLPALMGELGADVLRTVEEPGTEERAVERRLRRVLSEDPALGRFELLPAEGLFDTPDPPRTVARALPEVFSKWRRKAEKTLQFEAVLPTPNALEPWPTPVDVGTMPTLSSLDRDEPSDDPRAVLRFVGGETAGIERLQGWAYDGDHLRRYKETRNGMLGEAYSSKLSPWLATGSLSPRYVVAQTLRYERERVANDST